jgi:methionine synthase I (cobalamin-dependent)
MVGARGPGLRVDFGLPVAYKVIMTSSGPDRRDELVALMHERVLVLDGATGTINVPKP